MKRIKPMKLDSIYGAIMFFDTDIKQISPAIRLPYAETNRIAVTTKQMLHVSYEISKSRIWIKDE